MDAPILRRYRANKDEFFGTSPHSPLEPSAQADFGGLSYFDPDPDLVFTVPMTRGDGAPITVGTSDGATRTYHRAGTVTFDLTGKAVTLTLYDTGHDRLFLPFRDSTSGRTTYGAGRYLDVSPNDDGTVTVDFNLAYHPFCAYSDGYSCALPPHENWLTVPIEAGECLPRPATDRT